MKTLLITVVMMAFALGIAHADDASKGDEQPTGVTSIIREIR